jgi:HEAT repeat protein
MTTEELILEYVKVLVWPALVLLGVFYLRTPIKRLIERFTRESGEISAAGFGFELTAKFRETLEDLAQSPDAADAPELRESVKQAATDLAREQFIALATNFYNAPIDVRREAARAIARVAAELSLDELLGFAGSPSNGERVGAAIGLRAHMASSPETCTDPRVGLAVGRLLDDPNSRVRYRAVEAAQACSDLVRALAPQIRRLADEDANRDVKKRAGSILGGTG